MEGNLINHLQIYVYSKIYNQIFYGFFLDKNIGFVSKNLFFDLIFFIQTLVKQK